MSTPAHCLMGILTQPVCAKFRSTAPSVVKVLVTIFVHFVLLLAPLPCITRSAFGRYTTPSTLNVAPGPQSSLTVLVSTGSWERDTPCHRSDELVGGDSDSAAAC